MDHQALWQQGLIYVHRCTTWLTATWLKTGLTFVSDGALKNVNCLQVHAVHFYTVVLSMTTNSIIIDSRNRRHKDKDGAPSKDSPNLPSSKDSSVLPRWKHLTWQKVGRLCSLGHLSLLSAASAAPVTQATPRHALSFKLLCFLLTTVCHWEDPLAYGCAEILISSPTLTTLPGPLFCYYHVLKSFLDSFKHCSFYSSFYVDTLLSCLFDPSTPSPLKALIRQYFTCKL